MHLLMDIADEAQIFIILACKNYDSTSHLQWRVYDNRRVSFAYQLAPPDQKIERHLPRKELDQLPQWMWLCWLRKTSKKCLNEYACCVERHPVYISVGTWMQIKLKREELLGTSINRIPIRAVRAAAWSHMHYTIDRFHPMAKRVTDR